MAVAPAPEAEQGGQGRQCGRSPNGRSKDASFPLLYMSQGPLRSRKHHTPGPAAEMLVLLERKPDSGASAAACGTGRGRGLQEPELRWASAARGVVSRSQSPRAW